MAGATAVGAITAVAALAGAGAAVYSATKPGPKAPKMPTLPDKQKINPDPITGQLEEQRRRRAALAGRSGNILTGPGGLGTTGAAGAPRSTLLGM